MLCGRSPRRRNVRPTAPEVTLEQAKKIAAGAAAESQKNGWRMAIAVVDNHGLLVYFERMPDTQTASVQIALDKAAGRGDVPPADEGVRGRHREGPHRAPRPEGRHARSRAACRSWSAAR